MIAIFFIAGQYAKAQTVKTNVSKQPIAGSAVKNSSQVSGSVEKKEVSIQKQEKPAVNILLNPSNKLGVTYAENIINVTNVLIKENKLIQAKGRIQPMVEWLNDATEYHANLYKVLKDIDTAKVQADLERDLALKFAILRDKASFQLALLFIEEKQPQKAVDLLVDIVRSQPKTQLGFNSYQVLQQIGFTYKVQLQEPSEETAKKKE